MQAFNARASLKLAYLLLKLKQRRTEFRLYTSSPHSSVWAPQPAVILVLLHSTQAMNNLAACFYAFKKNISHHCLRPSSDRCCWYVLRCQSQSFKNWKPLIGWNARHLPFDRACQQAKTRISEQAGWHSKQAAFCYFTFLAYPLGWYLSGRVMCIVFQVSWFRFLTQDNPQHLSVQQIVVSTPGQSP